MNRLHRYCGARSLSDLKTIVLDSLPMSSSMVFQPNSTISGLLGVSKLLFVMILAARFWSFCSWLMSVDPAQPQTEQIQLFFSRGFMEWNPLYGKGGCCRNLSIYVGWLLCNKHRYRYVFRLLGLFLCLESSAIRYLRALSFLIPL